MLGEEDLYLFREGTHARLQASMGCQLHSGGATFRVWAPNAARVSVIGVFNGWDTRAHPLVRRADDSGIWDGTVDSVKHGDPYKFRIVSGDGSYEMDKADPFATFAEAPPPPRRARGASTMGGATARGWLRARRITRSARPCRSTKCISGRGDALPIACRRTGRSRSRLPNTRAIMASRTSN